MPAFEIAAPPSAYAVVLKKDTYEYVVDIDAHGFTRTGKDGAEKILSLFMNKEYNGEYLEPSWKKGWTNTIDADQAFVALVDSGLLKIKGEADIAGTYGYGYITSNQPVPLMDGVEVTVELEVPINDVVAGANRQIFFRFLLSEVKDETERPSLHDNTLYVEISVTDNGLLMTVAKSIEDADTDLFTGSTYDDTSTRSETAEKFTVWRLVFHEGVSGAAAPEDVRHMHVYLKQGVDRPTAEAATENELTTSPYDISDVLFNVGYPAYQISTQNADYFDDGNEAVSTYVRVEYPDFTYRFLTTGGDDYLDGSCRVYDEAGVGGTDESAWNLVEDEDHVFTGDCVIQNGLIRIYVDEAAANGVIIYWWTGAAWERVNAEYFFWLNTNGVSIIFPFIVRINLVSPEKTVISIRFRNSAVVEDNKYIDATITLERGKYTHKLSIITVFPEQAFRFRTLLQTDNRFVYNGDEDIGDVDIAVAGVNVTKTDNFLLGLDDEGKTIIFTLGTDDDTANRQDLAGGFLYLLSFDAHDRPNFWLGVTPFTLIANCFEEAEDATITAAVRSHFDGDGVDTVTENDGVWAATLNCAVDENNLVENSVGAACVEITSLAAGDVRSNCTPAAPLSLLKFDEIKIYLHRTTALPASVTLYFIDGAGKSVFKTQAITGGATEYTLDLPHSSTDLQGWNEDPNFDFDAWTIFRVNWNAAAGGEIVYVDGLRNYIGTTTTRGRGETLSGGEAVVLDAQNEHVEYTPEAGTDLPEGRYLAVYRAKDTDQVADDSETTLYDTDDAEYRNEQNGDIQDTLTAAFAYYVEIFDITAEDVSDTDVIRFRVTKETATENTMFIDYLLLIFLGEGESGPMDLAHNALQAGTRKRRLPLR